jgi:UDP-glucose:(heptosyl)LPS alpha-1,3-glucosyltransferase
MRLAFCLFKYFPFGGLQRDFKRIGEVCLKRGHEIQVYTMSWEDTAAHSFQVDRILVKGITNHRRCWNFSGRVNEILRQRHFDAVVGFNKMAGLDFYYAADPCYKARVLREKGSLYRLSPRYATYLALEEAVFAPASGTDILLISEMEKSKYIQYYETPEGRFHSLPPGISTDRLIQDKASEIRRSVRSEFGIGDDEIMLLMVGSSFKTKGLDRSLSALAGLPEGIRKRSKLFVIGEGNSTPFQKIALRLNIAHHMQFLGGRDDVPRFMAGADLLLHPAYTENTGTVLLEAMAAGLPVIATDICGYAFHVKKADAGMLIPSPFQQDAFNRMLEHMIASRETEPWIQNGPRYIAENDVFSMPEKAADIIETMAAKKSGAT